MKYAVGETIPELLLVFEHPHVGWEIDTHGYIVSFEGGRRAVLTNHGIPYFASRSDLKELISLIRHWGKSIDVAMKALDY